jgi:hypothetical protein
MLLPLMLSIVFHLALSAYSFSVECPSLRGRRAAGMTIQAAAAADDEPDLFEYFDPLLSPHAYPDGISPDKKPVDTTAANTEAVSPIVTKTFGFDLSSGADIGAVAPAASVPADLDVSQVFDPRVSPHAYANGTPGQVFGFDDDGSRRRLKVGILLMDHGSRNAASNDRLEQLARVYQERLGGNVDTVVVRAAHMEIVSPSIPEALEDLLSQGVDEIVCHPYFLSPGRHVKEDIPEIIQAAMESLDIKIPVVTTDPVGAETDVMIRAIHSAIQKTSVFT